MTAYLPILILPFLFQGAAMFVDEFYFHRGRGLSTWERVGHPLDSLSVLICYIWLVLREANEFNLNVYIGLAVFSCLFVTKDEFVHTKECSGGENWLHAFLFILHPVTFLTAALLWLQKAPPVYLLVQVLLVSLFLVYQILYWNLPWKKRATK